jgi:hypothetical protein
VQVRGGGKRGFPCLRSLVHVGACAGSGASGKLPSFPLQGVGRGGVGVVMSARLAGDVGVRWG